MKVLYSRTHYWFGLSHGGSVAHAEGVIRALSKRTETEVISNEKIYGVDRVPTTIIPPVGRGWHGELLYNFRFGRQLAKKIGSFKPDFVYHRYNGFSFSTARVCRKARTPLILEFNSSHLWKAKHWRSRTMKSKLVAPVSVCFVRLIEPYNLRSADMVVVVAKPLKNALINAGVDAGRILVNPNGVNPDRFAPVSPEDSGEIRTRLGIPEDRVLVGFAGTFGPWHGIPELTETILRISKDPELSGRVSFVLYGKSSDLREEMRERTKHLDNVVFAGGIAYEEVGRYLSACDVLISPHGRPVDGGEFFGSPTKMFEYMCVGKAIVASDLGQIGEVLKHLETAYLCPPGDVDELMRGIKYFVDHPEERDRMGRNARDEAMAKHTWDHNIDRMLTAFRNLRETGRVDSASDG